MIERRFRQAWKGTIFTGIALILVGLTAFSIEAKMFGGLDFISQHIEIFGFSILIGLPCLLVGMIGWAKIHGKKERIRTAALAIMIPFGLIISEVWWGDTNVHGLIPIYLYSMAPIILDGCVIAIMAVFARPEEKRN